MSVWQPFVRDAKGFSGDLYHGNNLTRSLLETLFQMESQKCFSASTLSRSQLFEWHTAFSEVVNL